MREWLICSDVSDDLPQRARDCVAFAKTADAEVKALIVAAAPAGAFGSASQAMLGTLRKHWEGVRSRVATLKDSCAGEAGIQVDVLHTTPDRVIVDTASEMRPFDLVICSQPLLDRAYVDDDIFEAALLVSGRPTLVLPREFTGPLRARNILVAWKNCREATRAIYDALPLLQRADSVTLMSVKHSDSDLEIGREALDRMTNSLCRRGVKATSRSVVAIAEGVRETIVREAERADLLVMGGYGHWRWTELIFGGVTRKVLQDMRTPVLMSR